MNKSIHFNQWYESVLPQKLEMQLKVSVFSKPGQKRGYTWLDPDNIRSAALGSSNQGSTGLI